MYFIKDHAKLLFLNIVRSHGSGKSLVKVEPYMGGDKAGLVVKYCRQLSNIHAYKRKVMMHVS